MRFGEKFCTHGIRHYQSNHSLSLLPPPAFSRYTIVHFINYIVAITVNATGQERKAYAIYAFIERGVRNRRAGGCSAYPCFAAQFHAPGRRSRLPRSRVDRSDDSHSVAWCGPAEVKLNETSLPRGSPQLIQLTMLPIGDRGLFPRLIATIH